MGKIKKVMVGSAVAGFVLAGLPAAAFADSPSGGDKQCVPGQNSQPGGGQKGGSCPPR